MVARVIDSHNGFVIRKLGTARKTAGYQTLPGNYDGRNVSLVVNHATLQEARAHIGVPATAPVKTTRPKSDYPEQQTGYTRKK